MRVCRRPRRGRWVLVKNVAVGARYYGVRGNVWFVGGRAEADGFLGGSRSVPAPTGLEVMLGL